MFVCGLHMSISPPFLEMAPTVVESHLWVGQGRSSTLHHMKTSYFSPCLQHSAPLVVHPSHQQLWVSLVILLLFLSGDVSLKLLHCTYSSGSHWFKQVRIAWVVWQMLYVTKSYKNLVLHIDIVRLMFTIQIISSTFTLHIKNRVSNDIGENHGSANVHGWGSTSCLLC